MIQLSKRNLLERTMDSSFTRLSSASEVLGALQHQFGVLVLQPREVLRGSPRGVSVIGHRRNFLHKANPWPKACVCA